METEIKCAITLGSKIRSELLAGPPSKDTEQDGSSLTLLVGSQAQYWLVNSSLFHLYQENLVGIKDPTHPTWRDLSNSLNLPPLPFLYDGANEWFAQQYPELKHLTAVICPDMQFDDDDDFNEMLAYLAKSSLEEFFAMLCFWSPGLKTLKLWITGDIYPASNGNGNGSKSTNGNMQLQKSDLLLQGSLDPLWLILNRLEAIEVLHLDVREYAQIALDDYSTMVPVTPAIKTINLDGLFSRKSLREVRFVSETTDLWNSLAKAVKSSRCGLTNVGALCQATRSSLVSVHSESKFRELGIGDSPEAAIHNVHFLAEAGFIRLRILQLEYPGALPLAQFAALGNLKELISLRVKFGGAIQHSSVEPFKLHSIKALTLIIGGIIDSHSTLDLVSLTGCLPCLQTFQLIAGTLCGQCALGAPTTADSDNEESETEVPEQQEGAVYYEYCAICMVAPMIQGTVRSIRKVGVHFSPQLDFIKGKRWEWE